MPERRSPFEGVNDFFSEVTRMRGVGVHGIHGGETAAGQAERTYASAWVPVTDILAIDADLVIRIELPGIDPAGVDLHLSRRVLTVSGSRDPGASDAEAAYLVHERYRGEFRRVIALPDGTEAESISAQFDNGLVEITVRGGAQSHDGTRIALSNRSAEPTVRTVTDAT